MQGSLGDAQSMMFEEDDKLAERRFEREHIATGTLSSRCAYIMSGNGGSRPSHKLRCDGALADFGGGARAMMIRESRDR